MKTIKFLFFSVVWLSFCLSIKGQYPAISTPWGTNLVHTYDCHGEVTHTYLDEWYAYRLSSLDNGVNYLFLTTSSLLFDDKEDSPTGTCFHFTAPWNQWQCSSTVDTIVLSIDGATENLVAGSSEWETFSIFPQNHENREVSAQVLVSISAPYTITGNDLVCSNPASFTLENVPSTLTDVSWQIKQGSTVINSGTGNTATANLSNGNYQAAFNMVFHCGLHDYPISKNFHFGPYSSSDYPVSGPSSASCNSYVYYSCPSLPGTTSIQWTWPYNWTYVSGQGTTYLSLRTGSSGGSVGVGVNNTCGQHGSYAMKYTSVYGCFFVVVYPNPAKDKISILIKEQDVESDSIPNPSLSNKGEENYRIVISDNNGMIHSNFQTATKSFDLSIQDLKNGIYTLTATKKELSSSTQFMVLK